MTENQTTLSVVCCQLEQHLFAFPAHQISQLCNQPPAAARPLAHWLGITDSTQTATLSMTIFDGEHHHPVSLASAPWQATLSLDHCHPLPSLIASHCNIPGIIALFWHPAMQRIGMLIDCTQLRRHKT